MYPWIREIPSTDKWISNYWQNNTGVLLREYWSTHKRIATSYVQCKNWEYQSPDQGVPKNWQDITKVMTREYQNFWKRIQNTDKRIIEVLLKDYQNTV